MTEQAEEEEDRHLMLGITIKGAYTFNTEKLKFPESYERPEHMAWANDAYGPFTEANQTGYDLAAAIRMWLEATDNTDFSACEVLMQESNDAVGKADWFLSHVQMFPFGNNVDTIYDAKLHDAKIWIDLFVLRQCQRDFEVHRIREVIREIGHTVVEIDDDATYLSRSFCVFEVFASVEGEAEIKIWASEMSRKRNKRAVMEKIVSIPVKIEDAQARWPEDKAVIDEFITESVGFETLNTKVAQAIAEGCEEACQRFHC